MSDKSKNILLGVLIVGLVSMTVAYAALSTSLQIGGTATVAATKWDVHFEDWGRDTTLSNVPETTAPTQALNGAVTKIDGFEVTLNKPGDKIVYNFKIANRGTIAAKLATSNGFSKSIKVDIMNSDGTAVATAGTPNATSNNTAVTEKGVIYNVTCSGADAELAVNATANCTLSLEYAELDAANGAQPSQTAGQNQTVNNPAKTVTVSADWNYVQK